MKLNLWMFMTCFTTMVAVSCSYSLNIPVCNGTLVYDPFIKNYITCKDCEESGFDKYANCWRCCSISTTVPTLSSDTKPTRSTEYSTAESGTLTLGVEVTASATFSGDAIVAISLISTVFLLTLSVSIGYIVHLRNKVKRLQGGSVANGLDRQFDGPVSST